MLFLFIVGALGMGFDRVNLLLDFGKKLGCKVEASCCVDLVIVFGDRLFLG